MSATLTSEGWVPYFNHNGVDMPVALNIPVGALATHLSLPQEPLRIGGALVYVAPGGELVVGPGEPEPEPGRLMSEAASAHYIEELKRSHPLTGANRT